MKTPDSLKPKVFIYDRGDTKILTVVYSNRDESYQLLSSTSFKELSEEIGRKYTRYDDEKSLRENRARQIHYSDKLKAHGLVCTCKEYEQYETNTLPVGQKGCTCKLIDDDGKELQDIDTDYIELNKKE